MRHLLPRDNIHPPLHFLPHLHFLLFGDHMWNYLFSEKPYQSEKQILVRHLKTNNIQHMTKLISKCKPVKLAVVDDQITVTKAEEFPL